MKGRGRGRFRRYRPRYVRRGGKKSGDDEGPVTSGDEADREVSNDNGNQGDEITFYRYLFCYREMKVLEVEEEVVAEEASEVVEDLEVHSEEGVISAEDLEVSSFILFSPKYYLLQSYIARMVRT